MGRMGHKVNFLKLFLITFIFLQVVFSCPLVDLSNGHPSEAEQSPTACKPGPIGWVFLYEAALKAISPDTRVIAASYDLLDSLPSRTRHSEIGPGLSPEMANSIRFVKLPENVKLI